MRTIALCSSDQQLQPNYVGCGTDRPCLPFVFMLAIWSASPVFIMKHFEILFMTNSTVSALNVGLCILSMRFVIMCQSTCKILHHDTCNAAAMHRSHSC